MFDSRTYKFHSQNGRHGRKDGGMAIAGVIHNAGIRQALLANLVEDQGDVEPFTLTAAYLATLDGPVNGTHTSETPAKAAPVMVIEHVIPTKVLIKAPTTVNATKRSKASTWRTSDTDRISVAQLARWMKVSTADMVATLRHGGEYVTNGRTLVSSLVVGEILDAYHA